MKSSNVIALLPDRSNLRIKRETIPDDMLKPKLLPERSVSSDFKTARGQSTALVVDVDLLAVTKARPPSSVLCTYLSANPSSCSSIVPELSLSYVRNCRNQRHEI